MKPTPVQKTLWVSLPLGILLGAAGAWAHASLLDEADVHIEKAEGALRKAADEQPQGAFGGHRKKALDSLGDARREIKKAKEAVGNPTPKPPNPPLPPSPKPEPTSSGPKKPPTSPLPPKKDPVPPKQPPMKPPEPPPLPPKK